MNISSRGIPKAFLLLDTMQILERPENRLRYEHVWFLDDDIAFKKFSFDVFFESMRSLQLQEDVEDGIVSEYLHLLSYCALLPFIFFFERFLY